jgi:hypothetical protein
MWLHRDRLQAAPDEALSSELFKAAVDARGDDDSR